jgi:PAS domain S-box-containing protein
VNEKVKEIKEHKEKFETIFNSSPDAITFCDLNGIIIECNEATLNLYGFSSREELCGKNAFELIAPKEHQKAAMLMETLFKKGSIKTLELISLTKDCKEFPAEASASVIKDAAGNPVGLVAITKDISKRKKMEDELKQERDMLEAVTDNIGAGLIIISKDYHALWANNFIKRYKGNVAGKLCYATLNTLDAPCPDCGVKKIFEDSVAIDAHEYCSTTIDGKPYWVEIIATPIKDKEGNVIAALELAVDITEKKIMQSKLAEYSQKLKKKVEKRTEQLKQTQAKLVRSERLAAIGELAAMVGHDLRNPLTGIMGAAYYLQTKHGADIGTKGKEMLKSIENAINYSNKIVNDLLEYSIDLKLDLAEVTPKALLKNALPFLEVPDRTQIVNATQDYPSVKADTEKMHRVFVNIIQNAFDAMPKGGTLTIKSREVKGKLEISFKDTGAGMSEENLSKLKREVPLFTTKAKGMGFGLPICRRIVEAHGGKLSVESKFEKGTKVTVTIPVNPKPVNKSEEKWIFSESMLSTITTQETP